MTYKAMYKCRLCGETFEDGATNSEGVATMTAIEISMNGVSRGRGNPLGEKETHCCPDGSIGYADFLGFKMEG